MPKFIVRVFHLCLLILFGLSVCPEFLGEPDGAWIIRFCFWVYLIVAIIDMVMVDEWESTVMIMITGLLSFSYPIFLVFGWSGALLSVIAVWVFGWLSYRLLGF